MTVTKGTRKNDGYLKVAFNKSVVFRYQITDVKSAYKFKKHTKYTYVYIKKMYL